MSMKQKIKTTVIAYLFIFPSLLGIVVFYIVPYIICLIKSLYAGQEFVGLKNYIQLFSNNTFLLALKNTAIFTFTAIPLLMIISFLLALFLISQRLFDTRRCSRRFSDLRLASGF